MVDERDGGDAVAVGVVARAMPRGAPAWKRRH
jgi:hypothetical protein